MLDDTRDIIRNEGLLLLISLTHSNAEIQKIIAFENAFDRLLAIILAEGATDGGIVVEDCLHLVSNLLRHNASNQNFFRETSCIQKLARLLIKYDVNPDTSQVSEFPLTHESNNWTNSQKVTNIIYILELFRLLVVPNSPNTAVNQKVMHTCEILTQLVNLGLTTTIPAPVRGNTLLAIGDIIRGYKKLQDSFSNILHNKENKNGSTTRPALLVIVEASLSRDDFSVRRGATYVIQSFLYDNPDAQLYFSATFTPPPTDNPNSGNTENSHSAASLIVNALTDWDASSSRKDPFRVFFACAMISNIVNDNPKAKELTMNVFIGEGDEAVRLLHKMMYQLSSLTRESAGLDPRVSIAVLSFMSVWLYDFSLGIAEFFTEGSNLQFVTIFNLAC